jgi:hypothetical protein
MKTRRWLWDDYLRYAWMVYYGVLLHGFWAIMVLFSDDPFGSTPLHALLLGHRLVTAAVLIAASGMAVKGVQQKGTMSGVLLLLPQQLLLVVSAIAGIVAAILGHYADLEPRPHLFIAADQLPSVVAAICHSFAIFDLHHRHRIRRLPAVQRRA